MAGYIKRILLIVLIGISNLGFSQNIQLEVFSGVSFAKVREKIVQPPAQINEFKYKTRVPIGLLIDAGLSENILIETGVISANRGTNVFKSHFEFNYVDIPVSMVVSPKNFRVFFGPVISILSKARFDGSDVKDAFEKSDWGFRYGLGVDIKALSLRLVAHNGMVDIFKDPKYRWRSNSISLTAGYLVVRRNKNAIPGKESIQQIHRKL